MQPLKVVFVVQGEGRGHMTQALALAAHLRDAGHEIAHVLVGRSPWRSVPEYFRSGIEAPVTYFDAPAQVPDGHGRAMSVARTAADVTARAPAFLRALDLIEETTRACDAVVNFLDFLGGVSRARSSGSMPTVALAHNYLFLHPELQSAPGPQHARRAVLAYAGATSLRADLRVALSFDPLPDAPGHRLRVAPPLLRPGLTELEVRDGGYLLAYALNPGYGAYLASWQRSHPDVEVHCYLDGGATAVRGEGRFHVHDLDQNAFLGHLAGCRAYVGSAGFESLCEAHWLGKPVLAVPTEGQFEQTLNGWDAERCGVARSGSWSELTDFWAGCRAPGHDRVDRFRAWVARAPEIVVASVEETVHIRRG
jgi:hypothetical protein